MNTINEWAAKYNVSQEALTELQAIAVPDEVTTITGSSEASAQQRIRLEAPHHGVRLWRNNVGACTDEYGNHIRYGLANESDVMNRNIKSSDLIGITPVTITQPMVGGTLGVFTAIECKRPGWKYKANAREVAQLSYMQIVIALGGIAQFATGPGDVWK